MPTNLKMLRVVLAGLVVASAIVGMILGMTSFGLEFDKYAYDFLFRLEQPKPWAPDSIILGIDEKNLAAYGGQSGIRGALADGLDKIRDARPAAVAVNVILADPGPPGAAGTVLPTEALWTGGDAERTL